MWGAWGGDDAGVADTPGGGGDGSEGPDLIEWLEQHARAVEIDCAAVSHGESTEALTARCGAARRPLPRGRRAWCRRRIAAHAFSFSARDWRNNP